MSNSTRQGGYDERLVVPLEASRRGAHRARTNPLVAALPLLVVVIVVAAVIGVAYALFVKPSGDTSASDPLTSATPPGATSAPSSTAPPSASASKSSSASSSSASASSSAPAAVDTSVAFTVANGSGKPGLAGRVTSALKRAGFSGVSVDTHSWRGTPVSATTVFYAKDSQKATAEAIASALGNGHARKSSSDANGGIVVVAFDEAAK